MVNSLQLITFLTPVALLGYIVLRVRRPEGYLSREVLFRRTLVNHAVFGYCAIAASRVAELQSLWGITAIAHLLLAGIGAAGFGYSRSTSLPPIALDQVNDNNTARRVAKMLVQLVYLALWIYSWRRVLLLGAGLEGPPGSQVHWIEDLTVPLLWIGLCYMGGRFASPKDAIRRLVRIDQLLNPLESLASSAEFQALLLTPRRSPIPFLQFGKEHASGSIVCDYPLAVWSKAGFDEIVKLATEMKIDHQEIVGVQAGNLQFARFKFDSLPTAASFASAVILSYWPIAPRRRPIEAVLLLSGRNMYSTRS